MADGRWRRLRGRLLGAAAVALLGLVVTMAGGAVVGVAAVGYTARSEFCNSCHIMDPYYESWQNSSHSHVACIDCHYEPGAVETFEGKFKALSQLAKYITRTAGTKPWAEVSDQSCMRSGCHSVRMLEGPLAFGRVKFDHRNHLLESRRGRRLRCVSCHSQIVQGEHVTVTEGVCYMCHFMPGTDHGITEPIDDCMVCHGPPGDPVDVAGRPFEHEEYIARGVSCKECHDPVVKGDGTVRKERCHSCHAEIGHIERFDETAFVHEMHVTDHKVECFECHDEIVHGLLPLEQPEVATTEGCGSCHVTPHDSAKLVFAGRGAVGVEDTPSRMYQTRVVCGACHTGRSGYAHDGKRAAPVSANGHPTPHSAMAAAAGSVDCIHCHGTGFAGMLESWQGAVDSRLAELRPLLERLAGELPESEGDPANPQNPQSALRGLYADARHNIELVAVDGSRGAHNIDYTLDALDVSAERLEAAFELLEPDSAVDASKSTPFRSAHGCSTCHLSIESEPVPAAEPAGRPFDHGRHFGVGLDCQVCHSLDEHGAPAFPRTDCASCHHREGEGHDPSDCTACHAEQETLFAGEVEGFDPHPTGMVDEKECGDCHGEAPDLTAPKPALCVLCHDEGFDAMLGHWQGAVDDQLARLHPLLDRLTRRMPAGSPESLRELHADARRSIELVAHDGSRGAHNVELALDILENGARKLQTAFHELDPASEVRALEGFPFRSEQGCSICHLAVEDTPTVLEDGRPFSHARHLFGAGLDCQACHSTEEHGSDDHGQPSFPRTDCASCHHQESPERDVSDCSTCHSVQEAFAAGTVEGFAPLPAAMEEKECGECHGEPEDLMIPTPALCVLCHEEGYDDMLATWRSRTDELREQVEAARAAALERGVDPEAVSAACRGLDAVRADGSRGVHHFELTRTLLEESLRLLEK